MILIAHGMEAAMAMGAVWQTVDARATRGGQAAIVLSVTLDLTETLVRMSVMQRPLARATDGAPATVGASVGMRSRVRHATRARQVALAWNAKASARRKTRAVDTVTAVGMEDVDVVKDGRESTVTSVHRGLMEWTARLSAAAS